MIISVYGLGKIGLPLAARFLEVGYTVIGVDINKKLVEKLNNGLVELKEPGVAPVIKKAVRQGRFKAITNGIEASKESQVKIIIIPIILDKNKKVNLRPLKQVCKTIAKGLKKGDSVVTETTLPPGTTKNFVAPLLEKYSKLKAGRDFFVAHCPERVYSGRVMKDFKRYKKLVGGIDKRSTALAAKIYKKAFPKGIVKMTSTEAEAAKVFGITYRNVNIALANELYLLSKKLSIDFKKVREAVNSIGFFHIHLPGYPGGHCVPVYPHFISERKTKLINTALEINEKDIINEIIKEVRKKLGKTKGKKILVLGRCYRVGIKEDRYSFGLALAKKLKKLGARVAVYDPLYTKEEEERIGFEGANTLEEAIKGKHLAIITTPWEEFEKVKSKLPTIDYFSWFS